MYSYIYTYILCCYNNLNSFTIPTAAFQDIWCLEHAEVNTSAVILQAPVS